MDFLYSDLSIYSYALVLGFVPALFWLWFWLHEGHKHEEPKGIIIATFILGGISVFIALFVQGLVIDFFGFQAERLLAYNYNLYEDKVINLLFVIIEEFLKFFAAYVIAFRTKYFNEPLDAFIYLMTAALGFAAVENTLYLIQPLIDGQNIDAVVTTYTRFIGANILHVTSSGLLSVFIGFAFCKSKLVKEVYTWLGLIFAILLHFGFNVFLMINSEKYTGIVYVGTWIMTLILMISLEKVKRVKCVI